MILWLDDIRNPFNSTWFDKYLSDYDLGDIVWVRTYKQFIEYIDLAGVPEKIFFDHDLGDNFKLKVTQPFDDWFDMNNDKEYTGYDCAKWLVNYCMDNNVNLPEWEIQSANPVGAENISKLLENFKKNQK